VGRGVEIEFHCAKCICLLDAAGRVISILDVVSASPKDIGLSPCRAQSDIV
jgi:hypothetical protein